MPELPEVETVRRGLESRLAGRLIRSAATRRPDLRFPFPENLAGRLQGLRILSVGRRAKYLLLRLSGPDVLVVHLGMTGRFTVGDRLLGEYAYSTGLDPAHDHLLLDLDGGLRLVYNDPRRFGFVLLMSETELDGWKPLAGLGPEPFAPDLSAAWLRTAFSRRRAPVKTALMDQSVVAGLGNIYVCEALFRAGISPARPAHRIGAARLARLASAIETVIREAIEAGGSSISDFADADGAAGRFQESFAVYGREGEPCGVCRAPIVRKVQAGRSSFYCPACQR